MCGRVSCTLALHGLCLIANNLRSDGTLAKSGDVGLAKGVGRSPPPKQGPLEPAVVNPAEKCTLLSSPASPKAETKNPSSAEDGVSLPAKEESLCADCQMTRESRLIDELLVLRPVMSRNIPPSQTLPAILQERASVRRLAAARWGLHVPALGSVAPSNARAETVFQSGAFRKLLPAQRCVLCVDGFYEWKKEGGAKQPFFFRLKSQTRRQRIPHMGQASLAEKSLAKKGGDGDACLQEKEWGAKCCWERGAVGEGQERERVLGASEAPMLLGGLYDFLPPQGASHAPALSAVILTTSSAETPMSKIHHRMPLVLSAEGASLWLSNSALSPALLARLVADAETAMREEVEFYAVSRAVGNVSTQGVLCTQPLETKPLLGKNSTNDNSSTSNNKRITDFFAPRAGLKKAKKEPDR